MKNRYSIKFTVNDRVTRSTHFKGKIEAAEESLLLQQMINLEELHSPDDVTVIWHECTVISKVMASEMVIRKEAREAMLLRPPEPKPITDHQDQYPLVVKERQ